MTDVDEHLLTAAKAREQVRGEMDGIESVFGHAGLVPDRRDRSVHSFLNAAVPSWKDSELREHVEAKQMTDTLTAAIQQGHPWLVSYIVGLTEQELDGSSLRLSLRILAEIANNDAPAFVLGAGNPETGKTNTMSLLAELRLFDQEEYMVLSNCRSWDLADVVVTSAHDLARELIAHRETPKFVLIDEASTHFDARTYRREVATQFTPLAKRFAKIDVDCFGAVGHTGKDIHPEAKRLATLAYYKTEKKVAEFYGRWPADADFPADRLFGGSVENLEPTGVEYDPDDSAPWEWNLEPEFFSLDLTWSERHDRLVDRGPADNPD